MTEIQNNYCEDAKCKFNRMGTRHRIQDHDILEKENIPTVREVFKPKTEDYLHSGVKGGLSIVPWAGGPLAEIFSTSVGSPLHRRLESYLKSIDIRIIELEKKSRLDSKSLTSNDEFIDIVTHATQIAVRTSQEEKIKVLRNCVLNTALNINIDRDRKLMYLNIINQITPTHLIVLRIIADPEEAIRELVSNELRGVDRFSQVSVLGDLGKKLVLEPELFKMVVNELESWGILQNVKSDHTSGLATDKLEITIQGLIDNAKSRVTTRGWEFLRFIDDTD